MTFKWKISHAPLECEFETGSIGEAIEILSNESSQLAQVFGLGAVSIGVGDTPLAQDTDQAATPARRGRKPKNQPDPSTASAPPPAPVPAAPAAPAAPAPNSGDGLKLPAFLDRSNPGNVATGDGSAAVPAAPPAPPPMPSAPPIAPPAPAVPPVGVLGPKMVDAITKQKQGDGAEWVKWLSDSGLVVPGVTFDEAMDCLRFTTDEKMVTAAAALQISAIG